MTERKLIPYAGFDSDEENFEEGELETCKNYRFPVGSLAMKDRLDDNIALQLRESGMGFKEIGTLMAQVRNRKMPYTYDTILHACTRARKQREQE